MLDLTELLLELEAKGWKESLNHEICLGHVLFFQNLIDTLGSNCLSTLLHSSKIFQNESFKTNMTQQREYKNKSI